MGLFGGSNNKNERKLSFALGGYRFVADDRYITYKTNFGKSFRVLKADIETVSLDQGGMGKSKVRINGKGALLAEVELPRQWAEKVQEFVQDEILVQK